MSADEFLIEGGFIRYISEIWYEKGRFPTNKEINKRLGLGDGQIGDLISRPGVIKSLTARGIKIPGSEEFSPKQLAAIHTYLNIYDQRPDAQKFADIGVTPQEWNGWMKGQKFKDYVYGRGQDIFGSDVMVAAQHQVGMGVQRGSIRHLRLFFDIKKWEAEQANTITDIRSFMTSVIETIQRHVTDQETLKAIAVDFENIVQGKPARQIDRPNLPLSLAEIEAKAEAQFVRGEEL